MSPLPAPFWARMSWHARQRRHLAQVAHVERAQREHVARFGTEDQRHVGNVRPYREAAA